MEVSRQQFAEWSFDRDRSVGLYRRSYTWDRLPKDEQEVYLKEADHYLKLSRDEWPLDILVRLEDPKDAVGKQG